MKIKYRVYLRRCFVEKLFKVRNEFLASPSIKLFLFNFISRTSSFSAVYVDSEVEFILASNSLIIVYGLRKKNATYVLSSITPSIVNYRYLLEVS